MAKLSDYLNYFKNYRRIVFLAILISFGGSFHSGFQLSSINPNEKILQQFINESFSAHYGKHLDDGVFLYLWPIIANLRSLGALIGAFSISCLTEMLGRKRSFYVTCVLLIIGAISMAVSKWINAWELLCIGRLVSGIAQGQVLGVEPVYLNEISPKEIRGFVGSITGVIMEFGFMFGSILALPVLLGGKQLWPFEFVVESAFNVILLLALPFLPESPKFLASQGDKNKAMKVMKSFLKGDNAEEESKAMLDEVQEEMKESKKESTDTSFRSLFSQTHIRRGIITGWMVFFMVSFCGVMGLSFFSTQILQNAGLTQENAQYATVVMSSVRFIGTIVGCCISDRFGRRPIMLWSTVLLLLANLLFIIFANLQRVHSQVWAAYVNIGTVSLINFIFGVGPSIIENYLTAELIPQNARSKAQMITMTIHWMFTILASAILYPLMHAVHEFSFLLHIIPLIVSFIYFWRCLPETKNKSQIEIMRALGYKGGDNDKDNGNGKDHDEENGS